MTHRPAFTILELLVASSLFAGLAVLAAAGFGAVLSSPARIQQSQDAAIQARSAVAEIKSDIEKSTTFTDSASADFNQEVHIFQVVNSGSEQYYGNKVGFQMDMTLIVPVPDDTPNGGKWHIYCTQFADPNGLILGKRLVRYSYDLVPLDMTDPGKCPTDPTNSNEVEAYTKQLFGSSAINPPTVTMLTSDDLAVESLRFYPVWAGPTLPASGDTNPPAIRIELVVLPYSGGEVRKSEKDNAANQISIRTLANRLPAYAP
jgi:type II secretory pathway component PulJ